MDVHHNYQRQRGVALIESLIAIVVLSIGLLGIASLHTNSMKTGASALNRSKAVLLADDLFERMMANRQAITSYNWANIDSASEPGTTLSFPCFEAAATGFNDGCDPQGIADADKVQWTELLQHRDFGLPEGEATITISAYQGSLYNVSIVINWADGTRTDRYTFNAIVNRDV